MENKVVHHNQADHWHGYFRVADHLLPQVLVRSGADGIFLNPKTAQRKHDPRFTTIALPSKQLNEVAAKAEACAKALGVVKMGESFAIRCRREDAAGIRAHLLPESAVPQDGTLYVAKNVPQVGRDELTQALQKKNWMGRNSREAPGYGQVDSVCKGGSQKWTCCGQWVHHDC